MKINLGGILRTIGGLGKGGATIAGALLGFGGAVFGGGDQLQKCLDMLTKQPASATALLGGALVLFGLGRKAGANLPGK